VWLPQVAALLVLYLLSAAALVAVRPFNSAALGALELAAVLAPLGCFAAALAVMGDAGATNSTRQAARHSSCCHIPCCWHSPGSGSLLGAIIVYPAPARACSGALLIRRHMPAVPGAAAPTRPACAVAIPPQGS
jgi:hypothetical protein